MGYNILYIEDLDASTISEEFMARGFNIQVYKPSSVEDFIKIVRENSFDAFIMDFRLTAAKGLVDAPTYAASIRTFGDNQQVAPIILITNETYLTDFNKDFTSKDLFDFILSKAALRKEYDKYIERIKDLINAYKAVQSSEYDLSKILSIPDLNKLDYRLISKINNFKERKDVYGYIRTIINSLIRNIGPLVGPEVLAARLGVDISDNNTLQLFKMDDFINCKYNGIMSRTYDRWWFDEIKTLWAQIYPTSLRRLSASERVDVLNKKYKLDLKPAIPISQSQSNYFWTICHELKKPLDPNEGYRINLKPLEEWSEPDYISLYATLENPALRDFLNPLDEEEVRLLGDSKNKQHCKRQE